MKRIFLVAALSALAFAQTVYLSDLDISLTDQGWGEPHKDLSCDNRPLTIGGTEYAKGLGTHADSMLRIALGDATSFKAFVGLDDEADGHSDGGSVAFRVYLDNKEVFKSGRHVGDTAAEAVSIDTTGAKEMVLIVDSLGSNTWDHADWADAKFEYDAKAPAAKAAPKEEPYILTPKDPKTPLINSAKVFGVRPGSPVLYTIAATGEKPMKFAAKGLPKGTKLNQKTGQITGAVEKAGSYKVQLTASNKLGKDSITLRLEVGDTIALTPPLGWNSWNVWGCDINEQKVRDAADVMVKSGLIDYGWQYINIDDCWMRKLNSDDAVVGGELRDSEGNILCNENFPDMNRLTDYVHSLGLKIGLYISPGPWTCAGFSGSWEHEMQDAVQFAEWGFDYLKYDWCGYGSIKPNPTLEDHKEPYKLMGDCLKAQPRDIVYSLCQYGMANVSEWGGEVGGNCWRTTGDIVDTWSSVSNLLTHQRELYKYCKPGNWNDPDMLVVGRVGWGTNMRETRLTPSEQYTHITMWSMLNSPLLIGCDMTQLDDFTKSLLCNREVLAVNQDPLGEQARIVATDGNCDIYLRSLEDGSFVVAMVNMGFTTENCEFEFGSDLPQSKYIARDLWRQSDLGEYEDSISFEITSHNCRLIKLTAK